MIQNNEQFNFIKSIIDSPKGVIVFALDREYRYTVFSKAHEITMKQIWGADIKIGMRMLDAVKNESDRECAKQNFDRALSGEYIITQEEFGDQNLARKFWEDRYSPLKDDIGNIIGLTVFSTDITEQVDAKNALDVTMAQKEALEEREILLNSTGEGIYGVDNDGNCTFINPAALEILGYKKEEVIGKNTHDLFHHHRLDGVFYDRQDCIIHKAISINQKIEHKDWLIKKNGEFFPVNLIATPVLKDGTNFGVVIAFNDITEQMTLENRLKNTADEEAQRRAENDKILESVFNSLSLGIFITDMDGYFVRVNEEFCKITGYLENELIGRQFEMLFGGDKTDFAVAIYQELASGEIDATIMPSEFEIEDKFGQKLIVHARFSKIRNADNEFLLQASIADITMELELKRRHEIQESIMIQQSKMAEIGEMIGAIIHQWRQPLSSINILIQDLYIQSKFETLDTKTVEQTKNNITATVGFMSDTMDNFRNFFKAQKEVKDFDISEAITDVALLIERQLKNLNIKICFECLKDCKIVGYENEFKQVILNILNNAKDAILSNEIGTGEINVSLTINNDRYVVSISDNGSGIPSYMLPDKIFEQYFTTKGDKGTGIGLSLAKTIIEKHFGGVLKANNADIGAVFTIELPINQN